MALKHTLRYYFLRALLMVSRSTLLLLAFITLILLSYLYFAGFPEVLTHKLEKALAERGIRAQIEKLYLNPFRGIIADNIIFLDPRTNRIVTSVSEVKLTVSPWKLIHQENPITSLEAKNVKLNIPVDPEKPSEGIFTIDDTQASGHFTGQNTLVIDSLTGVAAGVRFNLNAKLILNPLPFEMKEQSEEEKKRSVEMKKRIFGILKQVKFNREPNLKISVTGDLGKIESWKGFASLRANNLQLQKVNIDSLDFLMKLENSVLILEKFSLVTSAGNFSTTGYKHLQEPYSQFNIISDLDFTRFAFELNPDLRRVIHSFEFFQRPQISVSATQYGPGLENWGVYGRIHLSSFTYTGTYFERFDIPFALQKGELLIPQLQIKDTFGESSLKLLYHLTTREIKGEFTGQINPLNYVNLAPQNYQKYFLMFTQVDSPLELNLKASGLTSEESTLKITGNALIKNCSLVHKAFKQISTDVDISGGKLRCFNVQVVREEGKGTGELVYSFKEQLLQINQFKAQLNPLDIATVLGPKSVDAVKPYIFHEAPQSVVNGTVDYVTGEKTNVTIDITGNKIDYPLTKATLKFDRIQTRVRIRQGLCEISGFRGNIFGGVLEGKADFTFVEGKDTTFRMEMNLKDMSFQRFNLALFNYGESTGTLNAQGKFHGGLGDWNLVDGGGHMDVTKGKLVSLPFLGPLSTIMDAIIPGFASLQANKAVCDFTMEKGVIKTEKLDMTGGGWTLICNGFYNIPKDHLKMDARINMRGIFGAITFLMSKLFEYEADGTFKEPNWQPKNF